MTTAALLVVQAVLAVAAAGVSAWGVLSWSQISGAPLHLQLPPDQANASLMLLRAPLAALTGIAFVSWMWIATANARNAGALVRHAPGWALGGWLVPVLNLWRPKQMIDDLWRASMPEVDTGVDLRYVRKPALVAFWWAAYLLGTFLPAIAMARAMQAVMAPMITAAMGRTAPAAAVDIARLNESVAMWNLWAAVFLVVAAGLATHFVLRITTWQTDRTTPRSGLLTDRPLEHDLGASA